MTATSPEAADFGWLLENFIRTTPGVQHAVVVSADGLLMAVSGGLDRESGDQLAAIVSGVSALSRGAARQLGAGDVRQSVVEMDEAFFFLVTVSDGSVMAVAADAGCDVGLVGYEMAMLVQRFDAVLTPQLVSEMRAALPVSAPTGAGW